MTSLRTRFLTTTIVALALGPALSFTGCAKPQYAPASADVGLQKTGSGTCVAEFSQSHACVALNWEKMPSETDFGSFVFTVTSADGLLVDVAPKVVLWMPSMSHGSSPVTVEALSTGVYRAKNVFFTMKGDWEIRFQAAGDQAIRAITL